MHNYIDLLRCSFAEFINKIIFLEAITILKMLNSKKCSILPRKVKHFWKVNNLRKPVFPEFMPSCFVVERNIIYVAAC